MRVAIIAVAIVVASSPSLASPSCMTQSEARQKFPNAHLWWHGPNRCWDGTPGPRQRLAQRIKAKEPKPAQREARAERDPQEEKQQDWSNTPRWREAMSRMRPEDMTGVTGSARAQASMEPVDTSDEPRMNWRDRWVEVAQRMPPIVDKAGPADLAANASNTEPIVTPIRVMLVLLVLLLALGVYELLFRRTEWRR
jgi:hypothetical protein